MGVGFQPAYRRDQHKASWHIPKRLPEKGRQRGWQEGLNNPDANPSTPTLLLTSPRKEEEAPGSKGGSCHPPFEPVETVDVPNPPNLLPSLMPVLVP